MKTKSTHRILCQCERCKRRSDNLRSRKHFLEIEEGMDGNLLVKIKGIFCYGDELVLKEKDIVNCIERVNEFRKIRNIKTKRTGGKKNG